MRVGNAEAPGSGRQVFGAVANAGTDVVALIRRALDTMGRTGDAELTAFTDGCSGLRSILADAGVTNPPVLDWFMRPCGSSTRSKRHRAGLRVGTSLTENTANFLANRRMAKPQQMRWPRRGAHLLLQTRCAIHNGALSPGFGHLFEPAPSQPHPCWQRRHNSPIPGCSLGDGGPGHAGPLGPQGGQAGAAPGAAVRR